MDEIRCQAHPYAFKMVLAAPGGVDLDDAFQASRLWFVQGGLKTPVKLDPAGLSFLKHSPGTESLCAEGIAVRVDDNVMMALLSKDGRPENEYLVAVVYDTRQRKVLAAKEVGEINWFAERAVNTKPIAKGLSVLALRRRPNDGPEGSASAWLNVTFDGGRLSAEWDLTQPEVPTEKASK